MSNSKKLLITTAIMRGETPLDEVAIREPKASDLRGLKLFDVMQADIDSLATLLPRVSSPPLTADEVMDFNLADCAAVAVIIADFTVPSTPSLTA